MHTLSPLQLEVARLLVTALDLQEVSPEGIEPDAPLFGGGLGLDSLDALELALVVSKTYGFQMRSDDANKLDIFASLRNLSDHIEKHRVA